MSMAKVSTSVLQKLYFKNKEGSLLAIRCRLTKSVVFHGNKIKCILLNLRR
jgi:hypothetical protein